MDEDLDMDAQLANVTPKHGGSFIQGSLEGHSIQVPQVASQKSTRIHYKRIGGFYDRNLTEFC